VIENFFASGGDIYAQKKGDPPLLAHSATAASSSAAIGIPACSAI
jgi:hypothetical protein